MMSSNVPCKFFAEGRCRYGTSCRFSHQQQFGFGGTGTGVFGGGSAFGGGTIAPAKFNSGVATGHDSKQYASVEETMQKDMLEWEQGKIWPFSSYGPIGHKASLPGFEDLHPEEIRYEELISGNPRADLPQRLAQWQRLRTSILNDRSLAINLIEQLQRAGTLPPQAQTQQPTSNLFSLLSKPAAPLSSIFSGPSQSHSPQPGSGIFGQAPTNINPFQQQQTTPSGNIFGSTSPSLFSSTTQPQSSNAFGITSQPTNIFGGNTAPAQTTLFGQQGMSLFSTQPSFASATPQQQTAPSIFGGAGGLFGSQPQPPVSSPTPSFFGNSLAPVTNQQQPSMFGGATTNSLLSGETSTKSMFGGSISQPFGGTPAFGFTSQPALGASSITANVQPTPTQQVGFFSAPVASARDKFVYSDMSELTPEEIAAFEAETFGSCENIPLKAPPKELCQR